jgi:hypothetical protein
MRAEVYERRRRRYLLYSIVVLLGPIADLLTLKLFSFTISFPIGVVMSIYFFRAATRVAPSPSREAGPSVEASSVTPEQSLRERMKQG